MILIPFTIIVYLVLAIFFIIFIANTAITAYRHFKISKASRKWDNKKLSEIIQHGNAFKVLDVIPSGFDNEKLVIVSMKKINCQKISEKTVVFTDHYSSYKFEIGKTYLVSKTDFEVCVFEIFDL